MYDILNGVIRNGKFAGQPEYAPYFWQQVQEGLADERKGNIYIFDITPKDIKKYPALASFEIIKISKDRQGFISCEADYEDDE